MPNKIFYNASLPRSGSTLLQNVMMQNPDIYSTPTSGVIEFILSARTLYSNVDAFKAQDPDIMREGFRSFCMSGIRGFFNGITDRPYVIDKSRGWLGNYDLIEFYSKEPPKILCMVRDLRAIFSSMEKNYRKNPDKDPMIVKVPELKNMTTSSRIDHFSISPPIGPSVEWLSEILHRGLDKNILFIRFEDFTSNPSREIEKIYDYLEIPLYEHDFDKVEQLTYENDVIHGIFGDHTINPLIRPVKNDFLEILGRDQCNRLKTHYSWYFEKFKYI